MAHPQLRTARYHVPRGATVHFDRSFPLDCCGVVKSVRHTIWIGTGKISRAIPLILENRGSGAGASSFCEAQTVRRFFSFACTSMSSGDLWSAATILLRELSHMIMRPVLRGQIPAVLREADGLLRIHGTAEHRWLMGPAAAQGVSPPRTFWSKYSATESKPDPILDAPPSPAKKAAKSPIVLGAAEVSAPVQRFARERSTTPYAVLLAQAMRLAPGEETGRDEFNHQERQPRCL